VERGAFVAQALMRDRLTPPRRMNDTPVSRQRRDVRKQLLEYVAVSGFGFGGSLRHRVVPSALLLQYSSLRK
jgi:hypothetical protein